MLAHTDWGVNVPEGMICVQTSISMTSTLSASSRLHTHQLFSLNEINTFLSGWAAAVAEAGGEGGGTMRICRPWALFLK